MNKKLEVVDFLRGFAIFTIALMHLVQGSLTGALNKAASFGGAGVHVFILMSGFGLYLSYMRKPLGYGEFLKKRFGKVYWPYAIMVVAWVLWILASSGSLLWREGLSHLLLYKMFDAELDVSLCYPFWFISTIIQFYICWPLIVRIARAGGGNLLRFRVDGSGFRDYPNGSNRSSSSKITWKGGALALCISIGWATLVGVLGFEDMRPWGSCFLQYLWEFALGMWLADKYANSSSKVNAILEDPRNLKWQWLFVGVVIGMGLTGAMGWIGGILKLYNDIPSLMGYLSLLLIVYKASCSFGCLTWIKTFFMWASSFGYELYLVHSLVYVVIGYLLKDVLPLPIWIIITFVTAYIVAWLYSSILKSIIYKK